MRRLAPFIAVLLLWPVAGLFAAEARQNPANPVIYADSKRISEELLRADGHVEVVWGDYRFYADYLEYNFKTREMLALGRVTMSSTDSVLSGERLTFNFEKKSGELWETYGLMSPFLKYESRRLNQVDDQTIRFDRLSLTSCAQVLPRWKISCGRGKIKKDKYIEMSAVLIKIKNVPVFFLPYLRYPIKKDGRVTGLLFPNFGNSSLRGFFVLGAFYWNIRSNLDMTLSLDYYSKLGVGLGNEFRYLFRRAQGQLRFYYFRYRDDFEARPDSGDDYRLDAVHNQSFPFLNSRLVLEVNNQSRTDFLRLLDNNFDRLLSTNFLSSVYWTSSAANWNFSLRASRSETYYVEVDDSSVLQYLPSASLTLNKQKIGKVPGYFSLAVGYQNVLRSGVNYEYEPAYTTGVSSQRLSLVPSYQLPLITLPWLNLSLNLTSRHTIYGRSLDPETKQIVDQPVHVNYQTAVATIQGPTFYRLFTGRKKKLKHVIEPRLEFRYVSDMQNRDRLVLVDISDYPSYSYAGFSLTSRLFTKKRAGTESANELATLILSQKYFFDPIEANLQMTITDVQGREIFPEFSELGAELRLRPMADFIANVRLDYNHYTRDFSLFSVGVSFDRQDAPWGGSIYYSSANNPHMPPEYIFNRTVLRGDLRLEFPRFPLKFRAGVDYDFTDRMFRYGSVAATFDYQCLIFLAEFKVFSYSGRLENQFRLSVSLGNLGMASDFMGGK